MKQFMKLIFLLGFSSIAYAADPISPTMCPSIHAIKAAPFIIQKDFTTTDGRKFYIAMQEDQKYDTNWEDLWHFEVYGILATSTEDARQKLNQALTELSLKEGPIKGNLGWDCVYNIGSYYRALAMADMLGGLRRSLHR